MHILKGLIMVPIFFLGGGGGGRALFAKILNYFLHLIWLIL